MSTTVLFFGMATDLAGVQSSTVHLTEHMSVEQFKSLLFEAHPKLQKLQQFAIAINEEYAEESSSINPGDTIAIIPPVSGG